MAQHVGILVVLYPRLNVGKNGKDLFCSFVKYISKFCGLNFEIVPST